MTNLASGISIADPAYEFEMLWSSGDWSDSYRTDNSDSSANHAFYQIQFNVLVFTIVFLLICSDQ
ncbi:MAG TPA: hypothetical protein DCL77_03195 [Prolixibacteraceae bacterium]|jgi:hypothetical protein|nr:hypothetical protein [Prolixibacteraceae bacterium]